MLFWLLNTRYVHNFVMVDGHKMSFGSIQCRTSGVKFCCFKLGGLLKRDFTVHSICVTLSVFVHSYESVKLKYPQKMNRWK